MLGRRACSKAGSESKSCKGLVRCWASLQSGRVSSTPECRHRITLAALDFMAQDV